MARGDLEIRPGLWLPAAELEESASRASGPGGQNVNKVSTRVTLRFDLRQSRAFSEAERERLLQRLAARLTAAGEIVIHAAETRSQARNRAQARLRLAELLRAALLRPRKRVATLPGRAARARRRSAKQQQSERKRGRRPDRGEGD